MKFKKFCNGIISSVADPVHFFPDPDPDPRIRFLKYGSGSGSYLVLRYVFDVEQNNFFFLHFLTKSNHLMTLKIKDKNSLDETVF